MVQRRIIAGTLLLLFFAKCDDGFRPKGSFEDALSVYAVLQSTTDSQFVRVHATYDPPGFDPLEHTSEPDLSSAMVLMTSDSGSVTFSDSLIVHPDPQRYGTQLRIFYRAPFRPQRGLGYTLSVSVPGYPTASSRTIVPRSPGEFRLTNTAILNSPRLYESQDINLVLKAPPEARGFLPKFFIEYQVISGTPFIGRTEIPARLLQTEATVVPQYPELLPLALSIGAPFNVITFWSYQTAAYRYTLDALTGQYGIANVRFRRVIIYLYMVDENAYKYYNIVNGFKDEFSVRTDLPDYSNISGGVGVFGAVSLDSLSISVNTTILF